MRTIMKRRCQMREFGEPMKMKAEFTTPIWSTKPGKCRRVACLCGSFLGSRHDICRPNVPELAVADSAAVSTSLRFELVLVQRAIANGSSVDAIAPSPLSPSIAFVPATTNVWVKGLWFTSLFLSMTTALVAVLGRCLTEYWLHIERRGSKAMASHGLRFVTKLCVAGKAVPIPHRPGSRDSDDKEGKRDDCSRIGP
ncbi:hypothetical protein ARMSODRAFT_122196 [Armillaria solidipes]|uniref:DUF6535 domain-containing protein n=1 Tax=Armillaria solidipes TaxID=1076256 RepID=A0A2H3BGM5_9AGAR|nr:hypothetical protein ARMSODRAFT_122196 [Armillaria solidipes]